jgi:aromatic-L-amino-acid decarboxylase
MTTVYGTSCHNELITEQLNAKNGTRTLNHLLFDHDEHRRAAQLSSAFIERYHDSLPERAVFPDIDREAIRKVLAMPMPDQGCDIEELFEELETFIVPNSTHPAHPRFLPYVMPSPNAISPFAEMVASVLNQSCALWTLSPAANAIEQKVVRWLADIFELGDSAGGLITSGGSMANLIALTAARDWKLGDQARTKGLQGRKSPLVLYTSDEVHSSIDKAVSALGIGVDHLRHIPSDDNFRIRTELLLAAVEEDIKSGLTPFCVVASAGTVTTGAIDPIAELSELCQSKGLWLHVDGAFGALAALSERFREPMSAIRLADSVSLDPHKFLFTSFEAGCVLVRDEATLRHSFNFSPSYLALEQDPDLINYADYSPQLSRSFKALKVWWSLRLFGRATYAEVIDRMADLAAYMGSVVEQRSEFELLAPVVFNCVCFRLRHLDDEGNRVVLKQLVKSGFAFLGPASVKGRFGMRACFMNLRTRTEDIELIMNELARLAGSD